MRSILRWLYEGGESPSEIFDYSEEYKDRRDSFCKQRDIFSMDLTQEQIAELDHLVDEHTAAMSYESGDAFRVGFCLGARVMQEVLQFEVE